MTENQQIEENWRPVYLALRDWWRKNLPEQDFAPYLDVLSDQPPAAVMAAVRSLRAETWRPAPTDIYRAVLDAAGRQQADQPRNKERLRKDQQPATLERVLWLLDMGGETVCDCPTRAVTVHKDEHHVLRCARCRGIEQGQAFQAQDYGAA
jgi:hypothetical protein